VTQETFSTGLERKGENSPGEVAPKGNKILQPFAVTIKRKGTAEMEKTHEGREVGSKGEEGMITSYKQKAERYQFQLGMRRNVAAAEAPFL